MSFWDGVRDTFESIGGAVLATPALALDVASYTWDGKDNTFGEFLGDAANRGNQIINPLFDTDTATGWGFTNLMKGLDTIYREGVSEPIVTGLTVGQGTIWNGDNPFSAESWSNAYEVAQTRSIGQAGTFGALEFFDATGLAGEADATKVGEYDRIHQAVENTPMDEWMTTYSGFTDFASVWFLDPGVVAGKGAKAYKAATSLRKITNKDVDKGVRDLLDTEETRRFGPVPIKSGLATRTRALVGDTETNTTGWLDGKDAHSVFLGLPELKRSAHGRTIAALLADTNKIDDTAEKINARKDILGVAYGDTELIHELGERSRHIEDALENLQSGGALSDDLATIAEVNGPRRYWDSPEVAADLEGQVRALPDVEKFWHAELEKLKPLLDVQSSARAATARVSKKGDRNIRREQGQGLFRNATPNTGNETFNNVVGGFTHSRPVEAFYQNGMANVPLKVISKLAMPVNPAKFRDMLVTSQIQGFVNLHDIEGTSNQLDAMLRRSNMAPKDRFNLQSKFLQSKSTQDRQRLLERAETLSIRSLGKKYGLDEEDTKDFFDELTRRGQLRRNSMTASLNGRTFATAKLGDDVGPRVDLFDDDGTPVAMPLLETQDANILPLADLDELEKFLKRDHGRMAKMARAWQEEATELSRLSQVKAAGGHVLQSTMAKRASSKEFLMSMASELNRVWKFSVLFRLGYAVRNVLDGQARTWAKVGAQANVIPMFDEGVRNLGWNQMRRRSDIGARKFALRSRIATLDDLVGDADQDSLLSEVDDLTSRTARLSQRIDSASANLPEGKGGDAIGNARARLEHLSAERDKVQNRLDMVREREELRSVLTDRRVEEPLAERMAQQLGVSAEDLRKKKIGEGRVQIAGGYSVDDGLAGPYSSAIRELISSNDTMMTQLLDTEGRLMSAAGDAASWRTILQDEPGHLEAWSRAINQQIRQSAPARAALANGEDGVRSWLRTPEGREFRRNHPLQAYDRDGYAARVTAMVDKYVPEQIREAVERGEVSPKQLRSAMGDDLLARPEVHGGTLTANLGSGNAVYDTANKAMAKYFKLFGEWPEDKFVRHPFYLAMYRQEVKELGAQRVNAAEKAGRNVTAKELRDIERIASERARHEMKRTLFDLSSYSHAGHVLRFVSPFFAAHQEGLVKWSRIIADDPSALRRWQQFFDAPREAGIVYDTETGEQVEAGEPISSNHVIHIPLPKALGKKIGTTDWEIYHSSFNLLLQGGSPLNPGVGPVAQVPLEYFAQRLADEESINDLARTINPFPPDSPWEAALPATVKRVRAAVGGEENGEFAYIAQWKTQELLVDFQQDKHRPPTAAEAMKLMDKAIDQTRVIAWMRVGQNALSPAPAHPRSRYAFQVREFYNLLDQANRNGKGYQWAEDMWVSKYGEAFMPLIQSSSNNKVYVPSTSNAVEAIKRHKKLLNITDARVHRGILGAEVDGEFNPSANAFLHQKHVSPGSTETYRETLDPREVLDRSLESQGWEDYNKLISGLNSMAYQRGLNSYLDDPQLAALKAQYTDQLAAKNYAWEQSYNSFNPAEFNLVEDSLRVAASNPALVKDTARTDIPVLQNYLRTRDTVTYMLQARDAAGGSADITAQSNTDLAQMYRSYVSTLVESNTHFESNWFAGLIERDPLLLDIPAVAA